MSKAKMVPPRKPKGEAPSVTIANLERQVLNLTSRVEDVLRQRDQGTRDRLQMERERDEAIRERENMRHAERQMGYQLTECQAKLASTEQRFEGYRQAIEDIARP